MRRRLPMAYSALVLTGVNLTLRFLGTGFQVYLSRAIGAAGLGLLQLTLSVGSLAMVAGIGGIRTAVMYLSAEEVGRGHPGGAGAVISGGLFYSILCSGAAACALWFLSPWIANRLLGVPGAQAALRLVAAFLPVTCLSCAMSGYFTAAGRIGVLTAVGIGEQLISMGTTILLLKKFSASEGLHACLAAVSGSGVGAVFSLVLLTFLRCQEHAPDTARISAMPRLLQTALPLAAADLMKAGISSAENLMVPKRLAQNTTIADPLAAFGRLGGMVFPALMFPACILFALSELLIPEFARCRAAGRRERIQRLSRRVLLLAAAYATVCAVGLYLFSDFIGKGLYKSPEAAVLLRRFAPMTLILYCDIVTDAMVKGLGQQKTSVLFNILTNSLDVALLFFLLPKYGLGGYFFSFLLTHGINFALSLRLLIKTVDTPESTQK